MFLIIIALLSSPSFAQKNKSPEYFTVTGVRHELFTGPKFTFSQDGGDQLEKVRKQIQGEPDSAGPPMVPATQVGTPQNPTRPRSSGGVDPYGEPDPYGGYDSYGGYTSYGGLSILDNAMKIWDIIQKNRPVVTIDSSKFATALPVMAQSDWSSIGGFQPEANITYTTTYTNALGMDVVKFSYQVKVIYGGNINGVGLYIASARIIPVKLKVLWGYNADVQVVVQSVFNVRTPRNPLAAIQMNVVYTISNALSSDMTTDTFEMHGDGLIRDTKLGKTLSPKVLRMTLR